MHELSVTQSLLNIAVEEAKKINAKKIKRITLVIGDLTSIMDDSVQFYFDILSKSTIAEGAVLSFKRVPAEFKCGECGHVFEKRAYSFRCPRCGGKSIITERGQEFYIESMEVEADGD